MYVNKVLLSCFAATIVAGCATIIRGTEQEVSINTNPVGATVQFSNGQTCISPCTIKSARSQSLMITVSKPGCNTQTATMMPVLAGGGVLLGGLIDYGTGAVYDLQPNPLNLTLQCSPEGLNPINPSTVQPVSPGRTSAPSSQQASQSLCIAADGSKLLVGGPACPQGTTPSR
jgi:hypothetical protein